MNSELIVFGIWFCLAGTALAGLLPWIGSKIVSHRLSLGLLCISTLVGAIASLAQILSDVPSLELGNTWLFFRAAFAMDTISAVFFFITNLVASIVAVFAGSYVWRYRDVYSVRLLNSLTAVFILGMQGVLLSTTPLAFLASWEVMSLSSFFLVLSDRQPESIKAGLFYLIMTHLGAGAILASMMILSAGSMTATFDTISGIAAGLPIASLALAFGLALFGFGSKAGLWPFHVWLPEAHPQAPSHISALMSGVMLKLALYGFLRIALFTMGPLPLIWDLVIIVLGLFSAIYGVLYAVLERDLKRILAYSSIENLGLIFTMVGVAELARTLGQPGLFVAALVAVIFHALAHAIFKSGLFMGAGVIINQIHDRSIEMMGGLAKRCPKFSGSMLILALAAGALPPLSGFVGEWIFLQELVVTISQVPPLIQGTLILILAIFAFVGGLAVFAMVKMFSLVFLGAPRSEHASHAHEPSASMNTPVIITAIMTVLIGIFSPTILRVLNLSSMTDTGIYGDAIIGSGGVLLPALIAGLLAASILFVFAIRRTFSNFKFERLYHTWDCGQPIDATMEYTATAFSAPIRFFFRLMMRIQNTVVTTPITASNPWIASRTFSLVIRRIWVELIYQPIIRAMLFLSTQVRRLQNGVIQFYIALILLALSATIALSI